MILSVVKRTGVGDAGGPAAILNAMGKGHDLHWLKTWREYPAEDLPGMRAGLLDWINIVCFGEPGTCWGRLIRIIDLVLLEREGGYQADFGTFFLWMRDYDKELSEIHPMDKPAARVSYWYDLAEVPPVTSRVQ